MRILVIDDHPVMRFGVRQLIKQHWPDAEIGEANNLEHALQAARGAAWDVAMLDLSMPDAQGMEALVRLRRAMPALPILVLSMHDEAAFASRALQLGASGYLNKDHVTTEVLGAIERVMSGGHYISASLGEQLARLLSGEKVAQFPHETLSAQEYRVMLLIAEGKHASEIARLMNLSVKTIGTYRARIIEKTGLSSSAEMARYCSEQGLLSAH